MKIPLLGGAYQSRSADVSSQECVNLYYEPPPDGEQHDGSLVGVEGATLFAQVTTGASTSDNPIGADPTKTDDNTNWVRGAFVFDDAEGTPNKRRLFFLIKNSLYELIFNETNQYYYLYDNGTTSLLPEASNRVSMAANNFGQLVLAEGSKGLMMEGTTASVISDPAFIPSDMVVHQDGYFIMTEPNTNRFRYSALHNGSSWPVENYVTAQGRSDTVEALISDRRELWVFGDRSIEVYYNSGDSDIPFQRFQGGYIEMGIIAKFTAQKFDNTVAWLTQNDRGGVQVVRAGDGWTPIVISTPEVSYHMQQYSRVDDAFAYVYQFAGHEFYVLTFPTARQTWAYDALTKQWHRRGHNVNGERSRERYNCHAFYDNTHLFGDFENGRIYALSDDVGSLEQTDGNVVPMERVRSSQQVAAKNEARTFITQFQIDFDEGLAANSATGGRVWLSYSKDGGHTWSNERVRTLGGTGKYSHRVIWRKLGWGRNWRFRIRTWSTDRIAIKGAWAMFDGEQLEAN